MEVRRFLVWSVISLISGLGACKLCQPSDNESVFQEKGTYTYRYRSEALAEAVGTTLDHGKIVLECDVHVAYFRDCFYNLDLRDCVLTASGGDPGSQTAWIDHQPLPDLSNYPIMFALSFGEIKEVMTHEEDPIYFVNIKRGVLSAFVFKLSQTEGQIHESHTDIHGTCPLTSVPDVKTEGLVKTSKDMLLCRHPSRPDWQFSPWSLFWNMSFIQHVINSTTDCEYRMNEGEKRIEKVFCKERHAIMLESTHRTTTAVQTNLFYNLDFVKFRTSRPVSPILTRKTDILFEYEHTPVPQSSPPDFLSVAKKMLSDLVLDSVEEIRLFTIPQFTDFVGWIRTSHDLKPLIDSLKDCSFLPGGTQCDQKLKELAYSYTSDALLQCSSIPCAKGLSYMAMNGNLSPTYLNFVFHSWSYVHYSKPGFISNFVDMCRLKNSHQCWLSLGSSVRRTHAKYNDLDNKVLQEVTEVASYFYNRIAEECHVTTNSDKSYTECLIFLKAAGNIGQYYSRIAPDAIDQLLKLATNDHVPIVIRTSALEALKDVSDSSDPEQRSATYDRLLPLLKSSNSASSIRILSYEQLLRVSGEGEDFGKHLLDILKNDTNAEVKFYLAQSLNSLTKDAEFESKLFLLNLTRELRKNGLSLERILYETRGKSKSSSYDAFLSLPIMPDYIRRFGLKLKDAFIYDSPMYPAVFSHEALFQLFSAIVPTTKLGSYFEGWEELILSFRKNLAHMNGRPASFVEISEALMKALAEHGNFDEESLRNFDENIIQNLKKIHRLYWEHHKKQDPYAKAYLDLFGSTIKYFVQDNLQSSEGIGGVLQSFAQSLAEGVTYNATRVVRVIEAYHQVPTMMGLPLNWTTNATLAFSFRAGLKFQMSREDDQIHSKGFLQPSAALTFLNRMVLDFPTLTQIGVQANSSGYTSTELKGQYSSAKEKHTLRFERPARTQKILELFRTNQLIKHDRYDDIPDWDIERTSSSWCTKDKSDAGVKFCLSKSYPNVTHRIKPWALMAGWCKWQFLAHPTGSNDVHYDLELLQASKQKVKELTAKFTIAEKNRMKSSSIQMTLDESGSGMKLDLKTSLIPDFSASFSKNEISSKKVSGHKVQAALKILKDFKYELEYSSEAKTQKSSVTTNSPPDENSQTLEHELQLKVKTPYSKYKWKRTLLKMGENFKAEASLAYENLKTKSEWMKGILPPAFWANDKEASLKILLHWKKPIHSSQDTVTRQTEFRVQIPLYVMTLDAHSVQSRDREQTVVNLARTNVELGKIDTFLNFTSGTWTDRDHSSRIHVFNVTIPRKSWALSFESGHMQSTLHHELKLRRAVMKPTNDEDSKYIGWWSKEVSDRFSIDEREVKLMSDFQVHMWSEDDIADKFSSVAKEDLENISNVVYGVKVAAHYPFNDKIETVDFDGYFIFGTGNDIFRFQKTFNLTSSYHNLRLTSHSVYRNDGGRTLYHNSYFTHLTTKIRAYNTIHFQMGKTVGRCRDIEFNHYIRSHVMDLSTDATYKCESDADGLHTLRLKLNTNSSKWNMLDMKLDQIVEDVSPTYSKEEMTTYHALGTIHVDAEWFRPEKRHEKHVVLCSKDGNCPNAELFLEFRPGDKIIRFKRHDYEITCRSRMSSDSKALQIEVGYGNKVDGNSPVLDFTGDVLSRNYHVWKGKLYASAYHKVKDIFASGYETFRSAFVEVAANQSHPLNEILRPALKMTLHDYWNSWKAQFLDFFALTWAEAMDLFQVICVTTEPAYNILINSAATFKQFCASTYHYLEEKSVTVWAISYFHLPYYFEQGIASLPQYLSYFWNQLAVREESVMHFRFVTGKFFSLRSFLEWPSIEFDLKELTNFFAYKTGMKSEAKRDHRAKVAMLFGPQHVYTFDGYLYEFPKYPHEECSFLLAHDVHRSLFTVFSSNKGIHLLFPEMSVTISDQNEVFVNGSQEQSSLPIQSSNGKVTVKRGHVVEVWSPSLSVICRAEDFLCILKLSNYHIGGVIGLLGNADHNATNEFILPSGKPTSLIDFARNYEISGKPECQNLELTTASLPAMSEEETAICSEALAAECWDHPDIREQFTAACVSDLRAGYGTCYAAAGMSALCDLKYQPSHTDCSAIKQHDDRTIGQNLEVVLVVHESKYLMSADKSSSPAKGIESLVKAVDDRFKEAGYDKIHFSLVGYGGNGVHYHPTVHSSRKNIWSSSGDIINHGLKTLEFKSREEADGVKALKYAIEELGQDTFRSKVFIVITAKDKQVADKELLGFIHSKLEANGITLYVISSYPSIEKGKKVFGLRADGLIFPSQTEDGEAYMDYPKGNLAKLSSSTRGAVFLSKFLKDNKPSAFFAEVAQEIWAKVNKESRKCRSCSVYKGSMWWSRRECHIVHCL